MVGDAEPLGAWASRPRPVEKAYFSHAIVLITLYAGRGRDAHAPRGIRTVLYFRNLDIYELKTEAPMHDALGPFNCPQLRHKTDTIH